MGCNRKVEGSGIALLSKWHWGSSVLSLSLTINFINIIYLPGRVCFVPQIIIFITIQALCKSYKKNSSLCINNLWASHAHWRIWKYWEIVLKKLRSLTLPEPTNNPHRLDVLKPNTKKILKSLISTIHITQYTQETVPCFHDLMS